MNLEFPIKYRFHRRRGSAATRNSHSNPQSCIHLGARGKSPLTTSNEPPTPTLTGTPSFRPCLIHPVLLHPRSQSDEQEMGARFADFMRNFPQ